VHSDHCRDSVVTSFIPISRPNRTREIDCFDYTASSEPPNRHSNETSLKTDHPLHAKFAWLSRREEKHGLLDDTASIGTKEGWQAKLNATGFALRGHRLVRR
jgi:hypothetical protein